MNRRMCFVPGRFFLLLRNALVLNQSAILVVSGAIGGLSLIISGIDALTGCRSGFHQGLYLVVLYVGGIIVTSRSFNELHHPQRGAAWLILPASRLEKFASRWALSTILCAVGTLIFYFLFSVLSEGLNALLFGCHHPLFQPFDKTVMKGIILYFVLQSPFLAGAVIFRKHALSKTFLAFMAYAFIFSFVVVLAVWLLFWSHFDGLFLSDGFPHRLHGLVFSGLDSPLGEIGRIARWTWRALFWVVSAPVFWTIGYYRLEETER